jgi:hypothetical protein
MPSPIESSKPEKAGTIFSLKVNLIAFGAVTVLLAAGSDCSNAAWAKAEPEASARALLRSIPATMDILRVIGVSLKSYNSVYAAYGSIPPEPGRWLLCLGLRVGAWLKRAKIARRGKSFKLLFGIAIATC